MSLHKVIHCIHLKSCANDTRLLKSNHRHTHTPRITTFYQSYESMPLFKASFLAKVKCAQSMCPRPNTLHLSLSLYSSNRALGNIISGNLIVKQDIPGFSVSIYTNGHTEADTDIHTHLALPVLNLTQQCLSLQSIRIKEAGTCRQPCFIKHIKRTVYYCPHLFCLLMLSSATEPWNQLANIHMAPDQSNSHLGNVYSLCHGPSSNWEQICFYGGTFGDLLVHLLSH